MDVHFSFLQYLFANENVSGRNEINFRRKSHGCKKLLSANGETLIGVDRRVVDNTIMSFFSLPGAPDCVTFGGGAGRGPDKKAAKETGRTWIGDGRTDGRGRG